MSYTIDPATVTSTYLPLGTITSNGIYTTTTGSTTRNYLYDLFFEEMIEIASTKGHITIEEIELMWKMTKVIDKLSNAR